MILQNSFRQSSFSGVIKIEAQILGHFRQLLVSDFIADFANHGSNSSQLIQQIGSRISLHIQHFIKTTNKFLYNLQFLPENIVVFTIRLQIGVFDTAIGNGLLGLSQLFLCQIVLLIFLLQGARFLNALIEQVYQTNGLARSSLELFLVLT